MRPSAASDDWLFSPQYQQRVVQTFAIGWKLWRPAQHLAGALVAGAYREVADGDRLTRGQNARQQALAARWRGQVHALRQIADEVHRAGRLVVDDIEDLARRFRLQGQQNGARQIVLMDPVRKDARIARRDRVSGDQAVAYCHRFGGVRPVDVTG